MKILHLFIAVIVVSVGISRATSYAPPEPYNAYSPNGLYFVKVDPYSNVQSVYATTAPDVILWSFSDGIQFNRIFLSDDGMTAIDVAWKFISKGSFRYPAVTIYRQNGQIFYYSYRTLSKPRKYRRHEVGPLGYFWRVWLERVWQTNNGIMIVTPPHHKHKEINITTLAVTRRG